MTCLSDLPTHLIERVALQLTRRECANLKQTSKGMRAVVDHVAPILRSQAMVQAQQACDAFAGTLTQQSAIRENRQQAAGLFPPAQSDPDLRGLAEVLQDFQDNLTPAERSNLRDDTLNLRLENSLDPNIQAMGMRERRDSRRLTWLPPEREAQRRAQLEAEEHAEHQAHGLALDAMAANPQPAFDPNASPPRTP